MSPVSSNLRSRGHGSNISQNRFKEDVFKPEMIRASGTLFERLEQLDQLTQEQEEELKQKTQTIMNLENRIQSVLVEKQSLEQLLENINEEENNQEFEEFKERTQIGFEEKLKKETRELRIRIDELEHSLMTKDLKFQEIQNTNEESQKENLSLKDEVEDFKENYILKKKYLNMMNDYKESKSSKSSLESTLMFKDMRIHDLESKVSKLEEKSKQEIEDLRKKGEDKFEDAKQKWKTEKSKLDIELKKLKTWKNSQITEDSIDPEKV